MTTAAVATRAATTPVEAWARRRRGGRVAFLLPAGLALLAGLDAGLMLLGVPAPVRADRLPEVHGMLLVFGFLTTVIALERAVALRHRAGYAAPALTGLGGLLLLSPAPLPIGQTILLAGTGALVGVYVPLWHRQRDPAVLVQAFGAVLAVGALILWLGEVTVPALVPWLAGFVVLTIAGERLELARLELGPGADTQLLLLAGGVGVGAVAALLWPGAGSPLFGVALLGLTGWLTVHDVARRTIRSRGLPRFAAGCMLAAYFWLAVAAAVWTVGGVTHEGPPYDAVLHAVFLGFTVSMVLAHAPLILPAVLRRPLPYHAALIAPAVLLHVSLVLRLWVGDALGNRWAWQAGGVGNIAAVLLFAALVAWLLAIGSRSARAPR